MGLPGSGKTTLADELAPLINAKRLNADEVRKKANDWDFSEEGRKRQAKRMADFALKLKEDGNFVVADFICPTPEARALFHAEDGIRALVRSRGLGDVYKRQGRSSPVYNGGNFSPVMDSPTHQFHKWVANSLI